MSDCPGQSGLLAGGKRFWPLLFASLLLLACSVQATENQLRDHASPYLRMHADDPVAWQDWHPELLQRAKQEGRLIFVSSGYFSCHWCHVMQTESYRDAGIAEFLNTHFIPVKIDRELNPALDGYLIDYLERTQGHAGWPLNIFLTPEGYPLIGATYMPPDTFQSLLHRLEAAWSSDPDRMRDLARRVLLEITIEPPLRETPITGERLRQRLANQALAIGDPMAGGFGDQNKFPMVPQLEALLRLRDRLTSEDLDALLTLTLDQMAVQGLRDHIGGGFFRYTVDPSWQLPHFEKMLYTQAQMARLYLHAASIYGRQDYLEVARDTLDFVLREMRGEDGMFVASFSAIDEAGEEGGYYLWRPESLRALLGETDAALALRYWAINGSPLLEGGWLPRQGESPQQIALLSGSDLESVQQRLREIRAKLLLERARRGLPTDNKELAGWNGLLLGALAVAHRQLPASLYLDEAEQLANRIRERLWRDGELWRARIGDQPVGQAGLADYAYLADGLARLIQVREKPELRSWLLQLLEKAWDGFHDARGWRSVERPPLPGMGQSKAMRDGALPAASALLIETTLLFGNEGLKAKAEQALQQARPHLQAEPLWYASHVVLTAVVGD